MHFQSLLGLLAKIKCSNMHFQQASQVILIQLVYQHHTEDYLTNLQKRGYYLKGASGTDPRKAVTDAPPIQRPGWELVFLCDWIHFKPRLCSTPTCLPPENRASHALNQNKE